jgi:hypothetical protein
MGLTPDKPQSHKFIPVLSPIMATDLMLIQYANPVEPVIFDPCMRHPQLITI